MKNMREWFAFDMNRGRYLIRFDVSDGQSQFHVDQEASTRTEYLQARIAAVKALRVVMADHMVTEGDLIPLPLPECHAHRPAFAEP